MTDRFDAVSPLDFRYVAEPLLPYLSENGAMRYRLRVQAALAQTLSMTGLCPEPLAREIVEATKLVTTQEVYDEEARIKHDIRALVNCLRSKVSDAAKPFVHLAATSYDVIDTANAARIKDATREVLLPAMWRLIRTLATIVERDAEVVQIGRTHGQHAVPITFGFALANPLERFGDSVTQINERSKELVGKFSGAVGAYNALSLFADDPRTFEAILLQKMGLRAATVSTQIAPPEALIRLLTEIILACGTLAQIARDMRQLQRTEIAEVGEAFGADQVGSSTMPHKRNPINFENAESIWKVLVSRQALLFLDQVSEHQRDLTNSASGRTYGEIIVYAYEMVTRLDRTMKKLSVDAVACQRNLALSQGAIAAEPLYLLLAKYGHPDAHEAARLVSQRARDEQRPLLELLQEDEALRVMMDRFTASERAILADPTCYTGLAAARARLTGRHWLSLAKCHLSTPSAP